MRRVIPSVPLKGGVSVMSAPLHTALITFVLTITTTHGSPGVFVPLYLNPFDPGGLPRPFQLICGRVYVFVPAAPPLSFRRNVAPATVGLVVPGNDTRPDFATNFAR